MNAKFGAQERTALLLAVEMQFIEVCLAILDRPDFHQTAAADALSQETAPCITKSLLASELGLIIMEEAVDVVAGRLDMCGWSWQSAAWASAMQP